MRNTYAHETDEYQDGRKDQDREINLEGKKILSEIPEESIEILKNVERIFCSNALRTKQTLELIKPHLQKKPLITYNTEFYTHREYYNDMFFDILKQTSDKYDHVLFLGHNPGLIFLYEYLGEERLHFPIAGIGVFEIEIDTWKKAQRFFVCSAKIVH